MRSELLATLLALSACAGVEPAPERLSERAEQTAEHEEPEPTASPPAAPDCHPSCCSAEMLEAQRAAARSGDPTVEHECCFCDDEP